jgi:7-cyano-7-deazaguanine synthase
MKAIVIHSGGMDSSICLALAARTFSPQDVLSLSFSYDQRHNSELQAAQKISQDWGIEHRTITVDVLRQVTDNALMNATQNINSCADTMVLGRNGLMARLGAIYAHHLNASIIYMGVMELEVEYRDCSRHYMDLMQQVLRLDLADPTFEIRTPLVFLTKAQSLALADDLGILDYLLENTVTCYRGIPATGCTTCPACQLRNKGIEEYRSYI